MTAPVPAAFGAALRRHRLNRGWTQEKAARETGLGIATINRAEHGGGIYLSSAVTLAAAYGTTLDALLTPAEEPQP